MNYPFETVEDLTRFPLWRMLSRRQQDDVLDIEDRRERHEYFAECLRTNGYNADLGYIDADALAADIAEYLGTLEDDREQEDCHLEWSTPREFALGTLMGFLRWVTDREKKRRGQA